MKILIIEDEYSLADAIAETLKKEKFTIHIETDGEKGEDDYITKPFHMRELVARVKVVLKRKNNVQDTNILEYEDLKLDLRTGTMSTRRQSNCN